MDLAKQFEELEELVRHARFDVVSDRLRQIAARPVARPDAAKLAGFANRIGDPNLALRFLAAALRQNFLDGAAPLEILQYGHALRRLGAPREALSHLNQIDPNHWPDVLLQKANCEATLWNYPACLPLLHQYIAQCVPNSYRELVAKINLLSCLILSDNYSAAEALQEALTTVVKQDQHPLLHGNLLELRAHLKIEQGLYPAASMVLEQARQIMTSAPSSWYSMQIEKWMAVIEALQNPTAVDHLKVVRGRAARFEHWEIVRDCDYFLIRINKNKELAQFLFYGSPSIFFRSKIEALYTPDELGSGTFHWPSRKKKSLNLATGEVQGESILKVGQKTHRLISHLLTDFYSPSSLPSIFSAIHPGEFFDPINSPARIHQAITRFRKWSDKHALGLEIQNSSGRFHLTSSSKVSIEISQGATVASQEDLRLQLAQDVLKDTFSSEQLGQVLQISRTSSRRTLKRALEQGKIVSVGSGKWKRYKFAV